MEKLKTTISNNAKVIMEGLTQLFSGHRRWLLFFGSGVSYDLDTRLGISELTAHLKKNMGSTEGWENVLSNLEKGQSLETALTGVGLDDKTKRTIEQLTGDFVAGIDAEVRDEVLLGAKRWAGEELVAALVSRLPRRNPRLAIVTSNYDMLIEYACTARGIPYTTGFSGQIIRGWNWRQASEGFNLCEVNSRGQSFLNPQKHVELFKLHGSINLFEDSEKRLIECDLWSTKPPEGFTRSIAAPGEQKYEGFSSMVDPASLARQAQDMADAFAVIGYGFNDQHLHKKIFERVRSQDCPLLVLTWELPDDCINKLIDLGRNVWILTVSKTSAGKIQNNHTVVHASVLTSPVVLKNTTLWRVDCFARRIIGG